MNERERRLLELIRGENEKPKKKKFIEELGDIINGFQERFLQTSILPINCVGKIRITDEINNIAERQTRGIYDFEIKGYALFDWFTHNMRYDEGSRAYKNSTQTLNDRIGNCAEFSFLYIAMARSIGMESNFVNVLIDSNDEDMRKKAKGHACASIHNNGKIILVDPAYSTFDIRHRFSEIYDEKNRGIIEFRIEKAHY